MPPLHQGGVADFPDLYRVLWCLTWFFFFEVHSLLKCTGSSVYGSPELHKIF